MSMPISILLSTFISMHEANFYLIGEFRVKACESSLNLLIDWMFFKLKKLG